MKFAKKETIERLYQESLGIKLVDSHTHIQDDFLDFNRDSADKNLEGTQAPFNRYPDYIIDTSIRQNRLVRRLMMDATHGLFYPWFAQIVEGRRGKLDDIIDKIGDNSEDNRKEAGRMLIDEMQDSRYSEYAEWIRMMFSYYVEDKTIDPIDPAHYDEVYEAIKSKRNDPGFAGQILIDNNIAGYVTSIENRDKIPLNDSKVNVDNVDLSYCTHPESYNMFDANYLIWPEGATDFGLFFAGHKYESERFLIVLEEKLGVALDGPKALGKAVKEFFHKILWSPRSNPESRIRYTDIFHPIGFKLSGEYDITRINTVFQYSKACLRGNDLEQIKAFISGAMLGALDDIGREIKEGGEEYGSCLQIALGVTYFMDRSREILSFPVYRPGMPQEAYTTWNTYPNIHFEYILAHEGLYGDFSNAAKQVGNISVGPWWHFFRKHKISKMLYDQMTMGPISSIASGFTDARFVEMLAAKYHSVRWGVSMALAEMVDDPFSSMYKKLDKAVVVMKEILLDNPLKVHHLPFELKIDN